MKGSNVHAAAGAMVEAFKEFRQRWSVVRESWDDDAARAFDEKVVGVLEARIKQAIKGASDMGALMERIERECGDDDGA